MNRTWRRVPTECFCGHCVPNRTIVKGELALFIVLPGVTRPRIRCQTCAGDAPPDLPALPELRDSGGIEPSRLSRLGSSAPKRTRGALREAVKEWTPYRESREVGEEG